VRDGSNLKGRRVVAVPANTGSLHADSCGIFVSLISNRNWHSRD